VTRVQGGCAICRRIWALLQIHARQCRRDACMVPKCRQLKEQLRALAQQQAQMDERRRAAMNAAYRRCVYTVYIAKLKIDPGHTGRAPKRPYNCGRLAEVARALMK